MSLFYTPLEKNSFELKSYVNYTDKVKIDAIEEYIGSLSPAEQAEFNKQVDEMSRMFENMSEDEFEKFLGEMFAEEPMTEPNPFQEIQPVASPETIETVLSAEDKKKAETAIKILNEKIKKNN